MFLKPIWFFSPMQPSAGGTELCVLDIKRGLCRKQLHAWRGPQTNHSNHCLIKDKSWFVCMQCMWMHRTYLEIITLYKSAPTTSCSCRPIFYFTQPVLWPSPFGVLVLFLGRPLNDHCLAVSQTQTSLSLHWVGLNRCQYSHNTPSVPICQPRIVGQHSTVQLTSGIVKLTYANFVSFLPFFSFSFQGRGLNMEQQGKMSHSWGE